MISVRNESDLYEDLFSLKSIKSVLVLLFSLYYFFVFLDLFSPRIFEVFLLLVSFFYFFIYGKSFFKTLPFVFSVLFLFFVFFGWYWMVVDYEDISSSLPSMRSILGFLLFVPLAFLIQGDSRRIVFLFASSALGFLLSPLFYEDGLQDLVQGLYGHRVWLAGRNPIMTGVNSAVFIMFSLCFSYLLLAKKRYFFLFLTFFSLVAFIFYLYVSHSRSAYVGLFVVVAFSFSYLVPLSIFSNRKHAAIKLVSLFLFLAVIAYAAVASGMLEKTYREKDTLQAVLTMNFDSVPDTSWGYRVQMMGLGIDYMFQRPLKGWGSKGGEVALNKSGFNEDKNQRFSHLHNDYIEYGASYGFLFFLIYIGFVSWLLFRLFKSVFGAEKKSAVGVFLFFSLLFFVIVSNFDVVQTHSATNRLFVLTMAAALSVIWFGLSDSSEKIRLRHGKR